MSRLQSIKSAFAKVFGFFQTETSVSSNNFDNTDLVGSCFSKNNIEFGFFFYRGSSFSNTCNCTNYYRSSSGYTKFIFECFL